MEDNERNRRIDRLLDQAMDLRGAERAAFLRRECGDDDEMRAKVERLLRHIDTTQTIQLGTGGAVGMLRGAAGDLVPDLSGTTLDRYRIDREIGRGGMGVVFEAHDGRLDRTVAIKVLPARRIDDLSKDRFLREARAAASLNHPNIVGIFDAGEADGWPYLVMEYIDGQDLDATNPASIEEALAIASQVCEALSHAHERDLVHRDLKPGNVLVSREGGKVVAKLTDMGIALARGAARVTQTGAVTGTPTFMAPEQALGQELDGRADLYSLGIMLYGWVAGRPPFDGDDALAIVSQHIHAPVVPPRTYRADLPAGLEPVILRLLAKSPDERFESAAAVRDALSRVGTEDAESSAAEQVTIEGLTRGRMVGRQDELKRLQDLWSAAQKGRSHMALVSGEPGVGKTRLAFEMTATAQLDGALVLSGGCYENEATTPYLPFLEAFRRIARERHDDGLRDALGDTASEIARLAPEIESRLGPFEDRPSLSPQEERLRLFDAVARFLRRLAGPSALLFFLDDLQWADHGSLGLLHYLMRQLGDEPVLFLGTYREVELDRAHPLSRTLVDWDRERLTTRVRLERLTREETERMIQTLLGQTDVSGEFVARVHDETEGNPFFVEEIVKALIAEGGLVRVDSTWRRRRTTGEFVLPQSVKAAVGSRLERISDPCGDVLRTAAVLGKIFEFDELKAIARHSEDALLDALDEAVRAQLIASARGEFFRFTHDKIREVLYDELNPIRRRRVHARIAEGLEALRESGGVVAVEDLAHHYVESGDYEKGLVYADRAAQAATRVFAYEEALEMFDRARECADALERSGEVLRIEEEMADAAAALGDLPFATEQYERTIAATPDADQRNRLRAKCAEAYVVSGDPRGQEHARLALEELDPERTPVVTAQAMMIRARYRHLRGELEGAVEIYHEAIPLVENADNEMLVRMLSFLSGSLQHMANFEESDAAASRCIRIGERENVPTGVMLGHEFHSENSLFRGDWKATVENGEKEEKLAIKTRAGERYGWSHMRGYALFALGRLAEAEEVYRRAIDFTDKSSDRRLGLFMKAGLVMVLLNTGREEEAHGLALRVLREADEAELLAHRIAARSSLIEVLLRQGRVEDAAEAARTAVGIWEESGSLGMALIYASTFAEALVQGADLDAAREVLDVHAELAERTGSHHRLAQNQRVRARIAQHEGRHEEALSLYASAEETLEKCGSRMELARVLAERAAMLTGLDRADEAARDTDRAKRILADCGAAAGIL